MSEFPLGKARPAKCRYEPAELAKVMEDFFLRQIKEDRGDVFTTAMKEMYRKGIHRVWVMLEAEIDDCPSGPRKDTLIEIMTRLEQELQYVQEPRREASHSDADDN